MIDMHQLFLAYGWAMLPACYLTMLACATMAAFRTPRGSLADVAGKAFDRHATTLVIAGGFVLFFTFFVRGVSDPNLLRLWLFTTAAGVTLTPAAAVCSELVRRARRGTVEVQA